MNHQAFVMNCELSRKLPPRWGVFCSACGWRRPRKLEEYEDKLEAELVRDAHNRDYIVTDASGHTV